MKNVKGELQVRTLEDALEVMARDAEHIEYLAHLVIAQRVKINQLQQKLRKKRRKK